MGSVKATVKSGLQGVASAGTAEALLAASTVVRKVILRAPAGNTGAVFIGDSTVDSSSGYVLSPGEETTLEFRDPDRGDIGAYLPFDLADIYVDAANNDDEVGFLYATT